mgnify:CR=1 FL=1
MPPNSNYRAVVAVSKSVLISTLYSLQPTVLDAAGSSSAIDCSTRNRCKVKPKWYYQRTHPTARKGKQHMRKKTLFQSMQGKVTASVPSANNWIRFPLRVKVTSGLPLSHRQRKHMLDQISEAPTNTKVKESFLVAAFLLRVDLFLQVLRNHLFSPP